MDIGMIGKIEKAKRYAQERGKRIQLRSFSAMVDGDNNPHEVRYENGKLTCDCDFFHTRGRCSHTMALEYVLEDLIAVEVPAIS